MNTHLAKEKIILSPAILWQSKREKKQNKTKKKNKKNKKKQKNKQKRAHHYNHCTQDISFLKPRVYPVVIIIL